MNKLRLSYTLIRNWKDGRKEDCVKNYLHLETAVTPRMEAGSKFDKLVEESLKKTKAFPQELGGILWNNPEPKKIIVVDWPEDTRFSVKAEFDAYDDPTIIEIKHSASRDSAEISTDDQLSFYLLLADMSNVHATNAKLYRWDPTTHRYDMSMVWKSFRRMESARALINTYGPEIYTYFKQEGIL